MAAEPGKRTVRVRISGRVQGVGYRAWTAHRARQLGLAGWVRNVGDGTVECLVQGASEAVNALIAACQAGPPLARVMHVDAHDVDSGDTLVGFEQRPTVDPA